jgi:phage/plasmid-like protein (TIGR03299 family)
VAHNLYGSRYIGARDEVAWHGLGITKKLGEVITVRQALEEADMTFPYVMVPVGYTTPAGEFVNSGNRSMVLRGPSRQDDSWAELGVVSSEYRFLQNAELADGLDAICKATGWQFETAGALGKGETVFMSLRTGKRSVFGDNYDTFLIVSDGKCAQRALQISVAPVRVVCQNTLLMSDSSSLAKITIAHDEEVAGEYRFWLELIGAIQQAQDEAFSQLETMASVKITDKQAQTIIGKAFPLPGQSRKGRQAQALLNLPALSEAQKVMAWGRLTQGEAKNDTAREHIARKRLATFQLYERFNRGEEVGVTEGGKVVDPQTLEQIRNTPYAAVQAVTEMIDWGLQTSEKVSGASSLFGNGADHKQRAWSAALAVARK